MTCGLWLVADRHAHRINHLTVLQNTLGLEDAGVTGLSRLNALLLGEGLEYAAQQYTYTSDANTDTTLKTDHG